MRDILPVPRHVMRASDVVCSMELNMLRETLHWLYVSVIGEEEFPIVKWEIVLVIFL